MVSCAGLAFLALACQVVSSTRLTLDDVIKRFETALVKGDTAAAYEVMCPEYRQEVDVTQFSNHVKLYPYLQNMESLIPSGNVVKVGDPGVAANDCTIKSPLGFIPAVVYVRDRKEGGCIVSMVVAGMPVIGLKSALFGK
jgi:hypothetical protein